MEEAPICALGGAIFRLPVKLNGLLRHSSMLPKGAEEEIPLIKHDLEEIRAILHGHISRPEIPPLMVNCWMKEVRELTYDIEDCIDQYGHATDSKSKYLRKIPHRKFTSRKTNHPLHEKLKQRLWMANKIREFSVRVQEALQRHVMYNHGGISCTSNDPTDPIYDGLFRSPRRLQYGELVNPVGIDAHMDKLEEWAIKDGEQKLKVLAILGPGGIGKTTLANELYCKLGGQFDCQAFVRASQKPDMSRLFSSMLSQVRPQQPPHTWKVHAVIAEIRKHLQHKRYLIVVDGVWATTTWDIINCVLPDDNNCSIVLITTEIEDVARKCCGYDSKYVFKMESLVDDDSRKLFFSIAFGSGHECPSELSEVSNNIIRKCGGFPLAIVTVARLLVSQMGKPEQWDYLCKSLSRVLRRNTALEGMKQVLNLSYTNLPCHLKACMLYLSIYEEDYIIWKDDLVKQWIAEGFICTVEEQDKEEIAGIYFDDLVSRRMIQPVHMNDNNEVLSCVVHHMVLNLVAYESIQGNFAISMDRTQTTTRLVDKVRRLALHFGNAEDATPPANMRLSQVRTLAFFGVFKYVPSISEFRLLQVLILHFWGDEDNISFDLSRISGLFRLRYLHFTCNVTLELQPQMQGLRYLEALKIDARASAVPSDIVHLPGLLHLSLPANTNLPNGIDHMKLLRTLGCFDLSSNSIENVLSLGELTNLRDLQLTCHTVQSDILKNNMQCLGVSVLRKLSNLKSITLVYAGSSSCVDTLHVADATGTIISGDGLNDMFPPPVLQRLELLPRFCIFSALPWWIEHLQRLCILKIGVRELAENDVHALGRLPALTVLSLYLHAKPTGRIVFDKSGFSVLKCFKFSCSVPLLKFEADSMPNLQKLELGFSVEQGALVTMPVGVEHLSGLKKISAKIGGAGLEGFDRRYLELVMREMHPGPPNVNIQYVDWVFGSMDDKGSSTQVEEHLALRKQHEIMEDNGAQGLDPMPLLSAAEAKTSCFIASPSISRGRQRARIEEWTAEYMRRRQVRVSSGPYGLPDDGFSWRKYGQKYIFGAKHIRGYYRCTHRDSQGCRATKHVQRTDDDLSLFDVVYLGVHSCGQSVQTQPGQEKSSLSVKGGVQGSLPRHQEEAAAAPKRRKALSSRTWSTQVRMSTVEDLTPLKDGFRWRKYGQKDVPGAKHPTSYYRCAGQNLRICFAKKKVQRRDDDPLLFDVVYRGNHTCSQHLHSTSIAEQTAETSASSEQTAETSASSEHLQSSSPEISEITKATGSDSAAGVEAPAAGTGTGTGTEL